MLVVICFFFLKNKIINKRNEKKNDRDKCFDLFVLIVMFLIIYYFIIV